MLASAAIRGTRHPSRRSLTRVVRPDLAYFAATSKIPLIARTAKRRMVRAGAIYQRFPLQISE